MSGTWLANWLTDWPAVSHLLDHVTDPISQYGHILKLHTATGKRVTRSWVKDKKAIRTIIYMNQGYHFNLLMKILSYKIIQRHLTIEVSESPRYIDIKYQYIIIHVTLFFWISVIISCIFKFELLSIAHQCSWKSKET